MTRTTLTKTDDREARRLRIRELNDALRRDGVKAEGQSILITQGVNALGVAFVAALCDAVRHFETFTPDNDPHGEHDFGSLELDGERFFWKIDAYDRSLQYGSPDPSDPAVTHRVLTIMLASEY